MFLCVFGFCVFLLGRRGEMSKSVVFVKKCNVFVCFLGKAARWAFRLECTTYYIIYLYIYIYIYIALCLTRLSDFRYLASAMAVEPPLSDMRLLMD